MRCHSCGLATTIDDRLDDTCDTCAAECLCYPCRELRADMAEDRREEVARMAWREGRE